MRPIKTHELSHRGAMAQLMQKSFLFLSGCFITLFSHIPGFCVIYSGIIRAR